jgi:hypothetical protein
LTKLKAICYKVYSILLYTQKLLKAKERNFMSQEHYDPSNPQGREMEPGHARPMNPFFSGRLGRLTGIGTSSPYRNAGASAELLTFVALLAILIGTGIGAANQSLIIGIGSALAIIVLVIGVNLLIQGIRGRNKQS